MAQMLERYVYKNQKKMRCGYTTGTCAAAAAKAAAQMLLSGRKVTEVSVRTPSDITLTLPVCEIQMKAHAVSCAVQKDSGDDPDMEDQAGGVLYRGRCTDTDRRTGKERADICSDHQSQKKRKVAGAGRFLVGILRACMAAYDSAPPGDYVVLCEGD